MSEKSVQRPVPYYIDELKAYTPGKSIEEIRREYNPPRITKLASNENRWGHSPKVEEELGDKLSTANNYPDASSTELRQQLAEIYDLKLENIVLGNGSESLLSIIAKTFFLDEEDAVTAQGTFVGFLVQARIRGIEVKRVPLTDDYRFDVKGLLEAVNERTKMVYIANPNNPTGTYITIEEFEYLIDHLPDQTIVVMDEAYFEFARDIDDYPNSMGYRLDNVITLRTFSKAYGLAGFRVGYAMGAASLIRYMYKTKLVFEPSLPAQIAAGAALEDEDFLEKTITNTQQARQRLYNILDEYGLQFVRSQANSVMVVMENEEEAQRLVNDLMELGVILRPLGGFGLPHAIRITVGTREDMDHLEQSLDQVLDS